MTNREALNKSPFTLNEVKGLTIGLGVSDPSPTVHGERNLLNPRFPRLGQGRYPDLRVTRHHETIDRGAGAPHEELRIRPQRRAQEACAVTLADHHHDALPLARCVQDAKAVDESLGCRLPLPRC